MTEPAAYSLEDGGEGVYRDIVSTTHLADAINSRSDRSPLQTRRLSAALTTRGFVHYPHRLRWGEGGRRCRFYVRGAELLEMAPDDVRHLLDTLEQDRKARETDAMFED